MSYQESIGEGRADLLVYCMSMIAFLASDIPSFNDSLDVICKLAAFVGFTFTAMNQGYKWFKTRKEDKDEKPISKDKENN